MPPSGPISRTSGNIWGAARWRSTELAASSLRRRDPVELRQVLRRRRPVRCPDILLDLLRRGGTGDDARDHGIAQQPAEGEFQHGTAVPQGKGFELADDAPVVLAEEVLRVALVLRKPRARRRRRTAPVLAGEETAGEREVGQDAQAAGLRGRNELALDVALEQAVLVLTGDEGCEPVPARHVLRGNNLLRR